MAQVRQDNVQIKLEIDGSQSKTELDNLTRKADVLRQGLKEMKRGTDEYIASNKELREVNNRIKELQQSVGLTGLSTNQLGKLAKQLGRELKDLVPDTAAYIAKSQELVTVENRITELRTGLNLVRDSLGTSGDGFLSFVKKAAGFAGIQLGIQAAIGTIKEFGREAINSALKGSDSISDMEKSLNVTTAEAKALRDQLENIDTRTSEENLEGIAVAAGQLGIGKDQVIAFTTAVDQAVVALGDEFTGGVEEVTKSLGGLQKLFKETQDVSPAEAITKIGSAVNALGADGTATGPVIADFTARIGQLGNLAPQITQTLGLGAAFQELGLTAEISAGGITNILQTASKDTSGFGKQIGLTSKEFDKLINSDPNEVLLRLGESLRGASNTEIIQTLDGLNIKSQEAVKVVSLLANKTDFVREKQALASAEYKKGTSLLDEFAKKNGNSAAQVEKAEKSFVAFRQELGDYLIPIYLKVLQYTGLIATVLRALPGFVGENRVAIGLLVAALVAFNAQQVVTQVNMLKDLALRKLVTLGIVTETAAKVEGEAATYALTSAQGALTAALAANPIGFVLTLIAAFLFGLKQLYDRSENFRAAVGSLWKMLTPLGDLFKSLFNQLAPLAVQLGKMFNSIGAGKAILELFGIVMSVSVILPLKLLVTEIQLGVDAIFGFIDAGKRLANYFGADFKVDPNGSFDKFSKHLKENGTSIISTLLGQDQQLQAARDVAFAERKKAYDQRVADFLKRHKQDVEKVAKIRADASKASDLEALKAREANIRAALALVEAGSAEELRLKKLLVVTKRDIDLLGEKKTEGDKKVIRAEALRDLRQLQDEYDKKQADAAAKRAKEQADVEKKLGELRAGLLDDESERRIQQLITAAENEKATAKGTAEQIAEQRRLIMAKLAVDVEAERKKQADKAAADEIVVEKLKNSLIKNEFDRHQAELLTAHKEAVGKILDTEATAAEQRRLLDEKLQQDLLKLEKERVEKEAEINRRILDIDNDIALRRAQRKKQEGDIFSKKRDEGLKEELEAQKSKLTSEFQADIANENLTGAEKLALARKYNEDMSNLDADYQKAFIELAKSRFGDALEIAAQGVQTLADFEKIGSDKKLAQLDKDKAKRLAQLDAEYKSGTVSKELYEQKKASIEQNHDEQTRQVKRRAAEEDKKLNIAQSIIAGVLAVLKAGGIFTPTGIATAVFAAAATAKIIATPIPEFEDGGVFGRKPSLGRRLASAAGRAWRGVREYARGGRINATAGVADVGQRHSGGGIRMVDGATGEHLGEWERGEAYMILSRDTYANNKHLVDELIDTSLYRGGAPVRRKESFYEDGGTFTTGTAASGGAGQASAAGQELVRAVNRVEAAVLGLPSRQHIAWEDEDTANVEDRLNEREADRNRGSVH